MRTARRRRRTGAPARAAVLAAVVVTLAGLLGMHALSLHGTGTDGEHGALSLPAAHVDHTHALEHTDLADHGAADAGGHPDGDGHRDSDGHTTMMLCAAFLLAAGVLLLSGLWRRTSAWWLHRSDSRVRTLARAPWTVPTATGPPPEWAFSVIRC